MAFSAENEERLNTVSHGFGALLALFGAGLLWCATRDHDGLGKAAVSVYSISVLLLFLASTCYHAESDQSVKSRLRILDHISIYFLIAGTYTPVSLILLRDGNGPYICISVWILALIGTLMKLFYTGRFEFLSLALYMLMGWMIVFDFSELWHLSTARGIFLIFLGGAFYTLGIVFYVMRKLPLNHFIWHLFVLGGAISHWIYVYTELI